MSKKTIPRREWNKRKEERMVPDRTYFYTELEEKLLYKKGSLKNSNSDSSKALRILNNEISNNTFVLKSMPIKYSTFITFTNYLNRPF